MMADVIEFPRAVPGCYALSELPQSEPIDEIALSVGWREFDKFFKVYPGQFVVVTGTAGHGKSTFLFNVLLNLVGQYFKRIWMFVPENESHLRQKLRRIYEGTDEEFALMAAEYLFVQCADYAAYNSEPRTIEWILDNASQANQVYDCDVFMIDPWNELERARKKDEMLTDYIAYCLMSVKNFCKITNSTVFMVAHPTKASIGRTPGLADIEGSMNWYNKCDNGLIVERDHEKGWTRIISAKVREKGAGNIGSCYFHVDHETEQFVPIQGPVS